MSGTIRLRKWSLTTVLLIAPASFVSAMGQSSAGGVPTDWTHHRVFFSNPGNLDDAQKNGSIDRWNRIMNDERYQVQLEQWQLQHRNRPPFYSKAALKTDWSMDMGANATVGAGQYPAKYTTNFSTTTASCSDWVAYNTGIAGVSGGQANIVAYSNLYDTTCSSPNPSVYWAYYSGTGSALTSPVVSLDGTKIAYVENTSSGAYLRILQWHAGQGTAAAAKTPDHVYTNTTTTASGNTAWNTTNCPTTGSCLISVAFQNGAQDTISAPFYVYEGADTIYVGDAKGYLHKFTGVFSGTPAEVVSATAPVWPIQVNTSGTDVLTSPVYDSGTSGNIFVADSAGYLYGYKASTAVRSFISSRLTNASNTAGIIDSPMLDPTTEEVYVFVGDDANTATTGNYSCLDASGCIGVFQFAAGNTTTGTGACAATSLTAWSGNNCGEEALLGSVDVTGQTMYDGAFDHIYQVGTGTSGYIWACYQHATTREPRLSAVELQTTGGIVPSGDVITLSGTVVITGPVLTNAVASCSPVTEMWGGGGGTDDYIFVSVTASGSLTTTDTSAACTGACLYNFIVATGGTATTAGTESTPTTAYAGIAETGGTSGIVIDNNLSTAGESQIYYTPLTGTQTCVGNGSTGNGTGGCAVQTSQTVP